MFHCKSLIDSVDGSDNEAVAGLAAGRKSARKISPGGVRSIGLHYVYGISVHNEIDFV